MNIYKQSLQGKAVLTALSMRWFLFLEAFCMLASFQTLKKDCAYVSRSEQSKVILTANG